MSQSQLSHTFNESRPSAVSQTTLNKQSRNQSSSEKLHSILTEKSSSRIGRLNKNTQQIAIKQLINEDIFTKDFKRKIAKQEGKGLQTIRFKKDVKLEEIIQQRNVNNEKDIIDNILKQMKTKNLKFTQFDKDSVLQLHQPIVKDEYDENNNNGTAQRREDDESIDNDDKQDSDKEDKDENKNNTNHNNNNEDKHKKEAKKQHSKNDKNQANHSPTYQYYHMKFQFHDRNMTIDLHKKDRAYFSSFKTISRDKREYEENKMRYQIPGVGKYYPKFKVVEQIMPSIKMPQAELNRTRNFVTPSVYQNIKDLSSSPSKEYSDIQNAHYLHHAKQNHNISIPDIADTHRSKSHLNNHHSNTLNGNLNQKINLLNLKKQVENIKTTTNANELVIEDHEQSFNNSSNINLTPYKNLIKKERSQHSIHTQPSPNKVREGWNNAHGMLDFKKQSQRKFVFENLIRVNDERFNYIQLPQIYSKNRKVVGDTDFGKSSARRGLFKLPEHQPMYTPNFELTQRKNPQLVNMNVRMLKDLYHNIQ